MTTLTKLLSRTLISPEIVGSPGIAPMPAYCTTTTTTVYPITYITLEDGSIEGIPGSSYDTITTKCYPATPGTPPIASKPANIATEFNFGWSAGARSLEMLHGDGYASFSINAATVGAVVGLDSGTLEFSLAGAEHALYFRRGLVSVIESGVALTAAREFTTADVFRIKRTGLLIRYFQNDTLIYTSSAPSYGAQYLEASLYSGGDAVVDSSLTQAVRNGIGYAALAPVEAFGWEGSTSSFGGAVLPSITATGDGAAVVQLGGMAALEPIAAFGSDAPYSFGYGALEPLQASADGYAPQGGTATLAPIESVGGDTLYAYGMAVLEPLQAMVETPAFLQERFGYGSAVLTPLGATGGDTAYAYGAGELPALTASGDGPSWQGGYAVLAPITGLASDRPYAAGMAWLEPITGTADAGTAPQYAVGFARLSGLLAGGYGETARMGSQELGELAPITGFASDRQYAFGTASLTPITAAGSQNIVLTSWAFLESPRGSLSAHGGANAVLSAPRARVRGAGHDSTGERSAQLFAPRGSIEARGGSNARLLAPRARISGAGTSSGWGNAELSSPGGRVSGTGTVTTMATAALNAPMGRIMAQGGGHARLFAPRGALTASGTAGAVGHAALKCPRARVSGAGTSGSAGHAALSCPRPRLGGQGQAQLRAPRGRVSGSGFAIIAAIYEAYAINLRHAPGDQAPVNEVTRYTNFPFTQIVRFRGSYFGVAADGLYQLGGDTDDGEPIAYSVKTCASDFRAPELKTIASAYLAGRLGPLTVTLHAGEDGAESYNYTTPRGPTAKAHREKFGRGVKNRYFALALAGEDEMELDSIELEINKMSRRI